MTKTNHVGKYKFELIDENGKFYGKLFNMNAKKPWTQQIAYYQFQSEELRNKWVARKTESIKSIEADKLERKSKRVNFINPAKVGDILYSSWGYEQTNIDFYQVTEVKGKMVTIREIGYSSMEATNPDQYDVIPGKDQFRKGSEPIRKLALPSYDGSGYYLNLNSYASASLWDGKSKHKTTYA